MAQSDTFDGSDRVLLGRGYQNYRPESYLLPNDGKERQRLGTQHVLFNRTFGGRSHLAPLQDPKAILDVGCGTGQWAIDMANQYPNSDVTGIDLGQNQPKDLPPNYHYMTGDFEEEWQVPTNFDHIHGRMIFNAMKNHQYFTKQALSHLKPGGWFEVHEISIPFQSYGILADWTKNFHEGCRRLGVDMLLVGKWDKLLEEGGFVNIKHETFDWPFGDFHPDPKVREAVGDLALQNFVNGVEGFSNIAFTKGLGWSKPELDEYLKKVKKYVLDNNDHNCMTVAVIYAQKPEV